jgi:hypothetical protein
MYILSRPTQNDRLGQTGHGRIALSLAKAGTPRLHISSDHYIIHVNANALGRAYHPQHHELAGAVAVSWIKA